MDQESFPTWGTRVIARRAVSFAALVFIASGLAACAAGPDYRKPESAMPVAYPHAAALETLNASRQPISLDTWWDGFKDPALTRIIQRALDQNLDLAASIDGSTRHAPPQRTRGHSCCPKAAWVPT